ncbi:hypothetical protein EYF80_009641 [Liparis tanakae]|uniref:Uncharacterized protein n=1 Tax=Liparis tanakae TaxID=230148 RepID=A0A4Z2IQ54_9TELE|nr:hypothetical protein EYF80_009641 [Liparis tanakae]
MYSNNHNGQNEVSLWSRVECQQPLLMEALAGIWCTYKYHVNAFEPETVCCWQAGLKGRSQGRVELLLRGTTVVTLAPVQATGFQGTVFVE